jgi:hypothetical protein
MQSRSIKHQLFDGTQLAEAETRDSMVMINNLHTLAIPVLVNRVCFVIQNKANKIRRGH